ncbi:MAG: DMT family transporter [Magnetovibrio sp.]|nr:DMT family transporter [Magnetovibrio sp.]
MTHSNLLAGLASAVAVIFIWSGFIVFSRLGVTTGLTAYDVTALRFMAAGLIVLPFAWAWWPRELPWKVVIGMAVCGPGALYSVLMYLGLTDASAAYGGVFANGSLPIFTTLLVLILTGARPKPLQLLAVAVIMAGGAVLGYRGMTAGGADVVTGIALFLTASAVLSFYIAGVQHWQVTPKQALALINIPNAVVFLPVWYFFLPSSMADAEVTTIAFQALFQGIGPGFLAVILFAVAALHLGPTITSGFAAAVPASAALLAMPVLSETPTALEWAGIGIVTLGLGVLMVKR